MKSLDPDPRIAAAEINEKLFSAVYGKHRFQMYTSFTSLDDVYFSESSVHDIIEGESEFLRPYSARVSSVYRKNGEITDTRKSYILPDGTIRFRTKQTNNNWTSERVDSDFLYLKTFHNGGALRTDVMTGTASPAFDYANFSYVDYAELTWIKGQRNTKGVDQIMYLLPDENSLISVFLACLAPTGAPTVWTKTVFSKVIISDRNPYQETFLTFDENR